MSCDLKVVMVSDYFMCRGREFKSLGAEQLNDRAPIVMSRERLSGGSGRECILGGGRRGNWGLGCGKLCR